MKTKEERLNNTIQINLFGDPLCEILDENLETAAVAFKNLKESNLEVYDEDKVRKVLESDNPFKGNFLTPYNL